MDTNPDNHFIRITRSMVSTDSDIFLESSKPSPKPSPKEQKKRKKVQFKKRNKKQKQKQTNAIVNIFTKQLDKQVHKMERSKLEKITKYLLCEQIQSGKMDSTFSLTKQPSILNNQLSTNNTVEPTNNMNTYIPNEQANKECNKIIIEETNNHDTTEEKFNIDNTFFNNKKINKNNINENDVNNEPCYNITDRVYNDEIEHEDNVDNIANNNIEPAIDVNDENENDEYDKEVIEDDEEEIDEDDEEEIDEDEDDEDDEEDEEDEEDDEYNNFEINGTDTILYKNNKNKYLKTLSLSEKDKLYTIEQQIKKLNNYDIPIKYQILESNLDLKTKAICMEKLESLQMLSEESGEFHKMKTWLDTLLKCPFNVYKNLPISINNSSLEINEYLLQVHNKLHQSIYGQEVAKCQVLQYISQCITNPMSAGNVIGLCGPPGCGKTTLIKEGVSKAIDRPFAFITLGGSGGANMFEGHSYTYEGAVWGNIVNIIIQAKCMNPIIYMDELDKISNTKEGKEITGILTHLTDPSQNKEFHDRYFSNIDFDLSKALIIFSYNDESKIDPILRDRLKVIYTKGYNEKEKLVIVKDYMFPSILKNIGLDPANIRLSDDIIKYIITKTDKEDGVRNLKRSLETIVSKINVYKLNAHNLLKLPFTIKNFSLPLEITKEVVDSLLEPTSTIGQPPPFMYT